MEFIRQSRMIDPQAVQDSCVQVVNVDRFIGDVVTEIVGLAVGNAGLMPLTASQIV